METVDIRLQGPIIKAEAGKRVTLKVRFDRPCWSCIHERRSKSGYYRLNDQQGGSVHIYDALIHEDTTHFIFSIGDEGKPDLEMTSDIGQLWCPVEIVDKPEPAPEPKDLGNLQFKVGVGNDLHICVDNDNNTPETNDNWWDEKDFKAVMDIYLHDSDVKFIASCGDILECGSPKLATPEDDYNDFFEIYNVPYWQVAGLRFFTCTGNHDNYGMYESRAGDTILPERFTNYNSISGRNQSVANRIGQISIGGQGINGIIPGRGRIVFDAPDGKEHTSGQGDMCFFAYNAYVEMYKEAAGYTEPLTPSENRFSDEAIACMKNYVYSNWDTLKDSLSGWNRDREGMRNAYSKLNYYLKKDDNIFIFLSLDYGDDIWPINNVWHDRMIHARTIIDLNVDDPYIRRIKEFVEDTGYSSFDEPYNYQYYSVNTLIWLKEIIEHNTDKKIFVFTHHYVPNRVGNSNGIPQEGAWSYADISKAGVLTPEGMNKGSNCLTGIQFWFINKLINLYKNVVWFSGHSHISWEVDCHFDNHDYDIVSPSADSKYVYTKANNNPKSESAWCVSLPSLSKPRNIVDNQSQRLYDDAEMTIMEVYEKGIKIKGYKVMKDNVYVYDVNNPIVEKTIILL